MSQAHGSHRQALVLRWASVMAAALSLILLMRLLPLARLSGVVQEWIESLGPWGPLALVIVYIVAALLFVPGSLLTLLAGALYGLALGTAIVSLASTTAAALAFLIARYVARERVLEMLRRSPRLAAIDDAIGAQGWKLVVLLRLSPAIPFNVQNYLYGVTALRFWPAVLASWLAMLPGTFLYVYLGSLGRSAALGASTSAGEWVLRLAGLAATALLTIYLTRVAARAVRQQTRIAEVRAPQEHVVGRPAPVSGRLVAGAVTSMLLLAVTVGASVQRDTIRGRIERALGLPPEVSAREVYAADAAVSGFDHSAFDAVLGTYVDDAGLVDYRGLGRDAARLDAYLAQLADAPFQGLGRGDKLALLINAYNAFTLRLILDHYPVESIRDIPDAQRWKAVRWRVGPFTWSLDQIEYEQIRPKFAAPRIHFALVCAAIGCPPLRREAYAGARLDAQLAAQTEYVHAHPRWVRFDARRNTLALTALYDWYGGDFVQHAPTVIDYAAQSVPALAEALAAGRRPIVRWIEYDWRLNEQRIKPDKFDVRY